MFYESDRVMHKQLKYKKLRAYDIIQELEAKGLDDKEIESCIAILLKDTVSEFQKDVLDYALKTVTLRQEVPSAFQVIDSSYSFVDGRVQCKISAGSRSKTKKRKNGGSDKN